MGDFHQNGVITTLHDLEHRSLEDLEQDLVGLSRSGRKMSLILPSLYSELEKPALANIVDELEHVPYIDEIIIGLDRASKNEFKHARKYFSRLPQHHRILWNDGKNLRAVDKLLDEHGLSPQEEGKGRNVWYCLGYFLASNRSKVVALHDCDIITYNRSMVAKLFYPIANPVFGFHFCKGYYYRAGADRLNGRVARLLVTPLLRALKQITNDNEYLDYMDSFRYPLAGEFCMFGDVVNIIRIPSDWGLEVGVLSEVYRNYSVNRICQVDIADAYDHKHQKVSARDPTAGLSKMSIDICKALFRKLATQGEVFSPGIFRTLKASYYRIALDFVERYNHDAVINGLKFDRHREEDLVELFAQNIMRAGETYLSNPMETPFMPSWNRVVSAVPDIFKRLVDAVEADNS